MPQLFRKLNTRKAAEIISSMFSLIGGREEVKGVTYILFPQRKSLLDGSPDWRETSPEGDKVRTGEYGGTETSRLLRKRAEAESPTT